jgi:hypothetical protein
MLCEICIKKDTCTKICPEVNKFLQHNNVYKSDYIRPMVSHLRRKDGFSKYREIPFSSLGNKLKRQIGVETPESDTY